MKRKFRNNKPDRNYHSQKIKVILSDDDGCDLANIPFCEHGPCLLFEREKQNSEELERFYACSVCRDRKLCNFYRLAERATKSKESSLPKTKIPVHKHLYDRLKQIRALPNERRSFCVSCQKLILPDDVSEHNGHNLESGITKFQLKNPSKLLTTLINKDKEAQYYFSKPTIDYFVETILRLKFDGVLCVGAPRLHEILCGAKYKKDIKSFLLDYDERFAQFYSPRFFTQFNMFADHFYQKTGEKNLRKFFSNTSRLLIVVDPPFGGLALPIAKTIKNLTDTFKDSTSASSDDAQTSCMWIFPYFLESKIAECYPQLKMLDYQVEYENHPLFATNKKKIGSPIRIFTDISSNLMKMPQDKYRFCKECDKYVAKTNKHCNLCKVCPSKDGKTYIHCKFCSKCVKPTYKHCEKCKHCHLPNLTLCPRSAEGLSDGTDEKRSKIDDDEPKKKKKRK